MNENESQIKIKGRTLTVSVDGLSPIEISAIAAQVEEKIKQIEESTDIADTSKLAAMAAFEFATELYNLRQRSEISKEADSKKVDELVSRLENALDKQLF